MTPRPGEDLMAATFTCAPARARPAGPVEAAPSSFALQALDPHDAVDIAHGLHGAERGDGLGQRGLPGSVGHDDEVRVLAATLLPDGFDGHALLGKGIGDRCEHAG